MGHYRRMTSTAWTVVWGERKSRMPAFRLSSPSREGGFWLGFAGSSPRLPFWESPDLGLPGGYLMMQHKKGRWKRNGSWLGKGSKCTSAVECESDRRTRGLRYCCSFCVPTGALTNTKNLLFAIVTPGRYLLDSNIILKLDRGALDA